MQPVFWSGRGQAAHAGAVALNAGVLAWVTGRAPRGDGWSLDARSKTDCAFRLEVRARVEAAAGFVYLHAKDVTLLGRVRSRAADGTPEDAPR